MICYLQAAARDYLAESVFELARAGVQTVLHPVDSIDDAYGWYSGDDKELHVCMAGPVHLWLSTFVHELQHFRQHRLGLRVWHDTNDCLFIGPEYEEYDAYGLYEHLYSRRPRKKIYTSISETDRHELTRRIIECERDCELRTLREIELYRLPIKTDWFLTEAAKMLCSYAVAYHCGKWMQFDDRHRDKLPRDLTIDFFAYCTNPEVQRWWTKRKNEKQRP